VCPPLAPIVASVDSHRSVLVTHHASFARKENGMPPVYAATAPEWLQTVKTLPVGTEIAFWQATPAEPQRIAYGELWYFKERGRPLIHGFGLFRRVAI
jgi:hypothetical protein